MGRKPRVDRSAEEKWQIVQEGIKSGKVSETCRRHGIAPNLFLSLEGRSGTRSEGSAWGEKRCRGRKPRRTTASGSWNERWGGNRWRSKS